jgi:hypothetical protein
LVLTALLGLGCGSTEESAPPESAAALACKAAGAGALSSCSVAKLPAAYYVDQANRYFDALDVDAPADSTPAYAELVARWEWPPWLKLTGFTREQMESTDKVVKKFAPADVSHRDCRAFATQPFARCRVSFDYVNPTHGKPCFIYEEFTFNDAGEQTFIEAWSDLPGLTPILDPKDPWGERTAIHRLPKRSHRPGRRGDEEGRSPGPRGRRFCGARKGFLAVLYRRRRVAGPGLLCPRLRLVGAR